MTNTISTEYQSIIKELRLLMPQRSLSYADALQRAEAQANRLLSLHGITRGPVPNEIVTELPRVRVEHDWDMPVSGSAVWDGTNWVVAINAAEHSLRQRFSLFHEFKHILDHSMRHLIESDEMAERVADYFAACVLMPKAWVKAAFCNETQKIEALAEKFAVSPRAMSVRLAQLGLTTAVDRCERRQASGYRRLGRYFRQLPTRPLLEGVAA
jgi:Zn-dependent peptidase ImmA (M78 family)